MLPSKRPRSSGTFCDSTRGFKAMNGALSLRKSCSRDAKEFKRIFSGSSEENLLNSP